MQELSSDSSCQTQFMDLCPPESADYPTYVIVRGWRISVSWGIKSIELWVSGD